MYLALKAIKGKKHYYLRESFADGEFIKSRDIMDIGTNPGKHIIYPGGNSFYIDENLTDQLEFLNVDFDYDRLEDLFWPFVRPVIRYRLAPFRTREARQAKNEKNMKSKKIFDIHIFDRRRMHYLRFAQMDQKDLGRVSPTICRCLENKSRDEIEQYFLAEENILKKHEFKSYIYVIFDIQRHFKQMTAKLMPQALPQDDVDKYFLKELCRLNKDKKFWADIEIEKYLNEYLLRYAFMFFDSDYGPDPFLAEFVYDFMNKRRDFNPARKPRMSAEKAGTILGVSEDKLKTMSIGRLTRLYRRLASKHHPDKGGDHDTFVRLSQAYQDVLAEKKSV